MLDLTLLPFLSRASDNLAFVRVAVIAAAGLWGLFWIPLRALGEHGISAAWSTAIFYLLPFLLMVPFALYRWKNFKQGGATLLVIGFFFGSSMAFYANAYFFTDVVRVLLLYYLLPVWGTILARVMLGEPITGPRIISIGLGFSGMLVIFGLGDGIPWPRNIGDWMALVAGMIWAIGSVLTKADEKCGAFEITFCFVGWAAAGGIALSFLPQLGTFDAPSMATIVDVLPWMVVVSIVLIIPVCFTVVWGSGILSPGHLGILFMSEISVGVVGAALLTDEVIGLRELLGIILITSAGLCEVIAHRSSASSSD